MKLLFKIAGVLVLLAVVAVVALIFFLGRIVRSGVETAGPAVTKVSVKLDGANLSLFDGTGALQGFVVGNPEGFKTPEAIKVGSVSIHVVPRSVFGGKVLIRSIRVDAPEITYETGLKGSNLSKILENIKSAAGAAGSGSEKKSEGSKTALQVDEFVITGGKIRLGTSLLGAHTADLPLPEIRLVNLGQGPDGITPAELSAKALGAIVEGTVKAVAQNTAVAGKQAVEAAKEATSGAAESLKKAGEGIGDLFRKK